MMNSIRKYFSNINRPFLLLKWKVKADSHLFLSTTLLTFVYESSNLNNPDQELKLKSTTEGTILQLLAKEGEIVQPGSPLLILQPCTHELIVKEICAQCGADLWKSGLFQSLPDTDLKVTQEQAEQLKKAGEWNLLKKRKLALLICVDKTLIDTIDNQHDTASTEAYCTKVRYGTREFLKHISSCYELHFFTNGNLRYANKIAEILDPLGDLFSERIWTRQEGLPQPSSTENLKAIFPHGDSMVCIIDWQEGQFMCSPGNVIFVKPFSLSCNTIDKFNSVEMTNSINGIVKTSTSAETEHNDVPECSTNSESVVENGIVQSSMPNGTNYDQEITAETPPETSTISDKRTNSLEAKQNSTQHDEEESSIITCLGSVLVNIHKAYYELYDQMVKQRMYIIHHKAIPDLKNVIPYFRRTILKGVNIVFTGIFPTNMDNDTNPLCLLAKSLGAKISKDLILHDEDKGTTHIIALRLGTDKTNTAKNFKNIHIISPDWLLKCDALWERVDEKPFLLKKDPLVASESPRNKLIDEETILHNVSQQKRSKDINLNNEHVVPAKLRKRDEMKLNIKVPEPRDSQSCLTVALNLSPEVLEDMSLEVNKACSSEDSDDDDTISTMRKKNTPIDADDSKPSTSLCTEKYKNDIGTLGPIVCKNGTLKNISVPFWEVPCDNNVDDYSESESMCDYIYSEDEDNLLE